MMDKTKYWIALAAAAGERAPLLKEVYDVLKGTELSLTDIFDLSFNEIKSEFSFSGPAIQALVEAQAKLPAVEEDYFLLLDNHIGVIPFFSPLYPERLKATMGKEYPPFLYTIGKNELLQMRGAAILGDKFVSPRGELISYMAAKELARHRILTISGFAQGADMAAHRAALENGGTTVAVAPYGMLNFKLPDLLKEIFNTEMICVVSPFYPNAQASQANALMRNRIACALSLAVFIVEAPAEGGVLEAAKDARRMNLPLFTTQYAEYPPNAAGNDHILRELGGQPVRGRMEKDLLVPNMDRIIGIAKFQ